MHNMEGIITRMNKHLQEVPQQFRSFPEIELLQRPAPGKWSKQEILGHLVDSAINNLKRFTEVQFLPQPYTVTRYQQDDLVLVNGYQQLLLDHLLQLWQSLNRQIVYAVNNIPAEKLAFTIITPNGEPQTLKWLIIDYVEHLEHHLEQVRSMKYEV